MNCHHFNEYKIRALESVKASYNLVKYNDSVLLAERVLFPYNCIRSGYIHLQVCVCECVCVGVGI